MLQTLESDDVFYDIGANVGTYTCFAGQVVDDGNVIAFEPHPANVDRLRENAEPNEIDVGVQPSHSWTKWEPPTTVSGTTDDAGVGAPRCRLADKSTLEVA